MELLVNSTCDVEPDFPQPAPLHHLPHRLLPPPWVASSESTLNSVQHRFVAEDAGSRKQGGGDGAASAAVRVRSCAVCGILQTVQDEPPAPPTAGQCGRKRRTPARADREKGFAPGSGEFCGGTHSCGDLDLRCAPSVAASVRRRGCHDAEPSGRVQ
eukprot:3730203-Rhodomonas_salina.1